MSVIRILGVGSPYGEDSLGWRATRALENTQLAEMLAPDTVEYRYLDRPGPTLLNELEGAIQVVIIDAMRSGNPPGTVRKLELSEIETVLAPVSTHGYDLATSIALARSLDHILCESIIIGIEMGSSPDDIPGNTMKRIQSELFQFIAREVRETRSAIG